MSFENNIKNDFDKNPASIDHLDIPLLRYLWSSSPLSFGSEKNYHDFFKKINLLTSFSENEIRVFTKYLHRREFSAKEVIFNQGDSGYGLYFVFQGAVDIYSNVNGPSDSEFGTHVIQLQEKQYFGEMGLLENFNRRNATAITAKNTVLLGLFKPDLDNMLLNHPVLGAKFLREISMILANRLNYLTKEIFELKKKISEKE